MKNWVSLVAIVFFLAIIPNSFGYVYVGVYQNDTTTNMTTQAPSFYYEGNCNLNISSYITTPADSIITQWYSPDNIVRLNTNPTYTSQQTCRFQGNATSTTSLDDFFESKTVTQSTTTPSTWIKAYYVCEPDANNVVSYSNTNALDSFGYYPYGYLKRTGGYCQVGSPGSLPPVNTQLDGIINAIYDDYYSDCGSRIGVTDYLVKGKPNTATASCQINRFFGQTWWYNIPFRTSPFGEVNISVTGNDFYQSGSSWASLSCTTNKIYLHNVNLNSTSLISSSVPYSDSLPLNPDTEYWLLIGSECTGVASAGGTSTLGFNSSVYEININAYEPDYVCGPFSECEDLLKSKRCIDSNGIAPDKIIPQTCELGVLENATLGFEQSVDVTNTVCYPLWDTAVIVYNYISGLGCTYVPYNITIQRPLNWSVFGDGATFNRYFMEFTSEWATEGSRSLKLWTIPPKENEYDGTICTNTTVGYFPEIDNYFSNSTMSIGYNVTFPAENMRLTFDVKRCDAQVHQNYAFNAFNNSWISIQICPEYCYANSCDTQPNGNFYFNLQANGTSSSVFGSPIYQQLNDNKRHVFEYDLTNAGLVAGTVYELSFAVTGSNIQDTTGNCIMLDNVRYDVLDQPFTDIVGPDCTSTCVGTTYYRSINLVGGDCIYEKEAWSPSCVTSSIAEELQNGSDVCLDSNTLLHYNPSIADHEEIYCDNGCSDGHCLTSDESTSNTLQLSLYDPPEIMANAFTEWGITSENDLGIMWFAFSVFMLVNYIAIGAAIGVTKLFHDDSKQVHVDFKIFGSVCLTIIMGFFFGGYYPIEAGLTMLVILALFLYYEFGDKLTGKSGG